MFSASILDLIGLRLSYKRRNSRAVLDWSLTALPCRVYSYDMLIAVSFWSLPDPLIVSDPLPGLDSRWTSLAAPPLVPSRVEHPRWMVLNSELPGLTRTTRGHIRSVVSYLRARGYPGSHELYLSPERLAEVTAEIKSWEVEHAPAAALENAA